MLPPHRQGGHGWHARQVLQHLRPRGQQGRVAAELVEHKAFDEGSFVFGHQRPSAIQVRKSTAPVNVGHQQAFGLAVQRDAHVDDVAGVQVDLRR